MANFFVVDSHFDSENLKKVVGFIQKGDIIQVREEEQKKEVWGILKAAQKTDVGVRVVINPGKQPFEKTG